MTTITIVVSIWFNWSIKEMKIVKSILSQYKKITQRIAIAGLTFITFRLVEYTVVYETERSEYYPKILFWMNCVVISLLRIPVFNLPTFTIIYYDIKNGRDYIQGSQIND